MNWEFKTVAVIGLGYVGLPTAAVFASHGLKVLGVDVDRRKVDLVNQGKAPIVEPDLETLIKGCVSAGMLEASTTPNAADAFIIAVPTPFTAAKEPDLTYVEAATRAIAPFIAKGNLVIVESTSPVGTTERVSAWLAEARPDLSFPHAAGEGADVQVAHSPERVLPGRVLLELVANDRVIGGISRRCAERAARLYRLAVHGECLLTTARTAELVKLAENAYRDVNIAFANELSLVCKRLGIDVWEAIELANHHPRVNVLKPGPGVGGHCIAVDPWFIVASAPDETDLIRAARKVNDAKPGSVVADVLNAARNKNASVIACLGLAYKADIDDMRESPSIDVVRGLAKVGGLKLLVVEPNVVELPAEVAGLPGVELATLEDAIQAANIVVLLTDHRPFAHIDRAKLESDGKTTIDTRGLWR